MHERDNLLYKVDINIMHVQRGYPYLSQVGILPMFEVIFIPQSYRDTTHMWGWYPYSVRRWYYPCLRVISIPPLDVGTTHVWGWYPYLSQTLVLPMFEGDIHTSVRRGYYPCLRVIFISQVVILPKFTIWKHLKNEYSLNR